MLNEIGVKEPKHTSQNPPGTVVPPETGSTCQTHGKGWLTGGFGMAVCCAAPLILIAAMTFFGISLGALASGFLSLVALLACPVGMYFMMRMMAKEKK
jgi:DUF2933 family protein